jgi:hypothetical protein
MRERHSCGPHEAGDPVLRIRALCDGGDTFCVTAVNDRAAPGGDALRMPFLPRREEHTMKGTATSKLVRVAAVVGPAAALAAACGHPAWSDENLKQDVRPVGDALSRLVRLAAVVGPAAALAAACGHPTWSDENLKRDVATIGGSLGKLRTL